MWSNDHPSGSSWLTDMFSTNVGGFVSAPIWQLFILNFRLTLLIKACPFPKIVISSAPLSESAKFSIIDFSHLLGCRHERNLPIFLSKTQLGRWFWTSSLDARDCFLECYWFVDQNRQMLGWVTKIVLDSFDTNGVNRYFTLSWQSFHRGKQPRQQLQSRCRWASP